MKTLHIIIKGKVQGVGFRATVQHYAQKYSIKGTVRNLSDGSVEIYAQGPGESLVSFKSQIEAGQGVSKVDHLTSEEISSNKQYDDFQIIF